MKKVRVLLLVSSSSKDHDRMSKPWTETKGAVAANPGDIDKANAINRLLIRPINLLPCAVGDPVKPFAIGVWRDIRLLLHPNTAAISLRRAISAYTHSRSYFYACAQSDAFHHDIDGNAVGPMSAVDRAAAQLALSKLKRSSVRAASAP
jgi:ProP effector